jgi:putative MATE family efflux protein
MTKNGKTHQVDMLHGPLLQKLVMFALPLTLTSILQQLFNSADTAVVGHFVSSAAQAAVGANSSVINLLVNTFVGMSVGANVVVAALIARDQKKAISDAVHTIIAFSLAVSFLIIVIGELFAAPILRLMATPEDVIGLATLYLRIYFVGVPFEMVYNFASAILRARGDSQRPLYSLMLSGVINVILNLFFVIVLGMSVDGVAYATVISNAIAAGMVLYFLMTEEAPFTFSFQKLHIDRAYLHRVIVIGAPAGFQGALFSISNVVVQSAINTFGSAAVAGGSIALYFDLFAYFFCNGFSQACVTFVSQNAAAGKEDRCRKVFSLCLSCALLFTFIVGAIFVFFQDFFLGLYTADAAVLSFASIKMLHSCFFEFLEAPFDVTGSAIRGHGNSMLPTIITIIGTCLSRLGYVFFLFPYQHGRAALMNVYPISWILTSIIMLFAYYRMEKKLAASLPGTLKP